jgi:phage portal protein BeeE
MAFADWFTKKKPDRLDTDEPSSPIYIMRGQSVRFLSGKAIATADVAQRESPQLYRITNFIASSVQSVPWFCEPDPDTKVSEQAQPGKIKAINDLLKSPNDTYTAQQMQYWVALNLMLYARAHFKVGVGTSGTPNGLYPLAAKHVRGVLNTRGVVDKYEYGTGDNMTTLPSRRTAERGGAIGISYAGEIAFPSLTGLVEYNKAPAAIESLSIPLQIIKALMQRALDTATGHPNVKYVITAEKSITRQQKEALLKHLEESTAGGDSSGEILFLYNTDVKVHTLDNGMSDIHSKLPLDDMTRQIAGVFGVPVALLGLGSADAAKYASNYVESRLSYWQDTVVPCYLVPIAAGMTQAVCPPGARISFDLDAVPALWEGRANLGKTLSQVTFMSNNEKRQILGFEKMTGAETGEDKLPVDKPQAVLPPPEDTADPQSNGGRALQ